jgi:glycosyltransferase involved in cell wall biosynthesis
VRSLILCPGFPPAPLLTLLGNRVLPYIHDLFLMNRRADLNPRARLYMAPAFALAVRRLPRFLVNSDTTGKNLRAVARPDAEIIRFRPAVDNPFKLTAADRASRPAPLRSLRLVAMGTVEPRKNLTGAAAFLSALRAGPFPDATLDIIGRAGWNVDVTSLAATPGVTLHGYLGRDAAAGIMASADALLAFSHDEGLGLPLLEAQHAGLPVIANAIPVFSEVLGDSGLRVDAGDPGAAAAQVADWMSADGWRRRECARALDNVVAWNATAQSDRTAVLALIDRLLSDLR